MNGPGRVARLGALLAAAGLSAIMVLPGGSTRAERHDPSVDRLAIIETIDAIGYHADRDQWDRVAELFNPAGAVIDYTSYAAASVGAAEPEKLAPGDIVARWKTVLPGYDYTQHLISNHLVRIEGDEAVATSVVYATHILSGARGGETWTFLGDYLHRLVRTPAGWKVDRMTANLRAELGNPELPQLAAERVRDGLGRSGG
jgi:hypothetical protein